MVTETHPMNLKTRSRPHSGIIWDNHGCMPLRADDRFLPQLERYRQAGVDVISLNVGMADVPLLEHLRVLSFMRQWIAKRPDVYHLISTVQDIELCKAEGKLGVVFDIEGMCPVQSDSSFVQTFRELGVRWMLIAYNRNNKAGGGCLDVDQGLTDIGRAIIDEMQRVGMVLCVSHTGPRTAAEALEYSRNPVIFSHSNPSVDWPHPRNVSDALMRACARKGGVVGLTGIGVFIGPKGSVAGLLRQLRYVIDLIGPEHVGLSLDYAFDRSEVEEIIRRHPELIPRDMDAVGATAMIEPESIPQIVDGLMQAKLSDAEIRGILGENWLRIAKLVW